VSIETGAVPRIARGGLKIAVAINATREKRASFVAVPRAASHVYSQFVVSFVAVIPHSPQHTVSKDGSAQA
jgi:hypothetical protein